MYTFTTCCGGPLYGPADSHRIFQIGATGFTSRAPFLKNRGDFKILKLNLKKQLANLSLEQNKHPKS
jgi:hypothetical protein